MKSRRISVLAVLFVFIGISLNAQVFIGGNLGFNATGGTIDNGNTTSDKLSTISFYVSPIVGKFISEKLAVGIALNFQASKTTIPGFPETVNTTSAIGVAPFLRYYAIRMNKFSVFGQGNVGFSYGDSKSKTGGITTDGPRTTVLYLNIVPGLSYDVSDNLSLETTVNIFNFGYNLTSVKDGNEINKTSTFGIGAGLSELATVGSISIGAIYKF